DHAVYTTVSIAVCTVGPAISVTTPTPIHAAANSGGAIVQKRHRPIHAVSIIAITIATPTAAAIPSARAGAASSARRNACNPSGKVRRNATLAISDATVSAAS